MKSLYIISFGVLLFFSACYDKNSSKSIVSDSVYSTALQYTQKADLVINLETKAIFIATYLNHIPQYNDENHNFIVGVYIPDSFYHQKYNYTIYSDDELLKLTLLSDEDRNSFHIPLENKWAKYYKVHIAKKEQNSITLNLVIEELGDIAIEFNKKLLPKI
ncbi:MAG: hypothetical protein RBQ81_00995 [Arcobacteraceae bacterium]|nr:hypothetical protein [Arcobacteraceae bacterium]